MVSVLVRLLRPTLGPSKNPHFSSHSLRIGLCMFHDEHLHCGVNYLNINGISEVSRKGSVTFDVTEVLMSCLAAVMTQQNLCPRHRHIGLVL
jgi:hypothetical protein